jgi:hypothetical protein
MQMTRAGVEAAYRAYISTLDSVHCETVWTSFPVSGFVMDIRVGLPQEALRQLCNATRLLGDYITLPVCMPAVWNLQRRLKKCHKSYSYLDHDSSHPTPGLWKVHIVVTPRIGCTLRYERHGVGVDDNDSQDNPQQHVDDVTSAVRRLWRHGQVQDASALEKWDVFLYTHDFNPLTWAEADTALFQEAAANITCALYTYLATQHVDIGQVQSDMPSAKHRAWPYLMVGTVTPSPGGNAAPSGSVSDPEDESGTSQ